ILNSVPPNRAAKTLPDSRFGKKRRLGYTAIDHEFVFCSFECVMRAMQGAKHVLDRVPLGGHLPGQSKVTPTHMGTATQSGSLGYRLEQSYGIFRLSDLSDGFSKFGSRFGSLALGSALRLHSSGLIRIGPTG